MTLGDFLRLTKHLSFKDKCRILGYALKVKTKRTVKIMTNLFHKKQHSAQKYTYGIPKEEGYYWFDYINEMEDIVPREPVEVYEDENTLEMVVAFIGSEDVMNELDLDIEYKKDASGQPLYRFQKITQAGESGVIKKRKEES